MSAEVNFMVGGEAGQGVQTVGFLLSKTFVRGGYYVFADQDYESRIRGGHNFFRVRVKDTKVDAIAEPVDILIAMNKESIDLHQKELAPKGVIIYDGVKIADVSPDGHLFPMPLEKLATDKAGDKRAVNTVAIGAALYLLRFDLQAFNKVLREYFGGEGTGEANVKAAAAGYDYARESFRGEFAVRASPISGPQRMLLNGNEAISLGAIAAGCKFMSAYPMTPTTSIMEFLASKSSQFDLNVVQPEDEIAAINMAIGAGFVGLRAMTATSGSGFCLMVEGLGLAGITETPIVVVEGQRPGPAVGLPTRTEQGDLEFMIYAHHGEFPRAVLAPADADSAFWLTIKAFNLAEKYQLPVIILEDHYLASSYFTVDRFDLSGVSIDRGRVYSAERDGAPSEYKRHKDTPSGVSPRAFPGLTEALVVSDADEHDEEGHLTESAEIRTQQVAKRMRKLLELKKEIAPPRLIGPSEADVTLIGWGSTYGPIREAMGLIQEQGKSVNFLHLTELWPFPAETVNETFRRAQRTFVVENNYTGQLAHLIRAETGNAATSRISKYDGRPFTPAFIAQAVMKEMV